MTEVVLTKRHETQSRYWLEITLNRPDKLNAFTDEVFAGLRAALTEAADDDISAVVLTGAGRGFCAGQDLASRDPRIHDDLPDLGETLRKNYNPIITMIRGLNKPVICAVNGVAAGAGANLVFACDIVLAARSAKFIQSFAKIGLIPDAGGTHSLVQALGPLRSKAWAMTAEPLSAEMAQGWGLVYQCFDDDVLMDKAREMAAELARGATLGLAEIKHAMHHAVDATMEDQLNYEADAQVRCGASHDHHEGVMAFLEKRPPQFTGKA